MSKALETEEKIRAGLNLTPGELNGLLVIKPEERITSQFNEKQLRDVKKALKLLTEVI